MPLYFLYHVRGWSTEVHDCILYLKLPDMYLIHTSHLILITQIEGLQEHLMDAILFIIL